MRYIYWMNNRLVCGISLAISVSVIACIYDPPRKQNNDITIINHLPDSLYYYVHDYQTENDYTYNFAYDSIAARDTSANQRRIAYNINDQKILPNDTLHPTTFDSWKARATKAGGLTVLFYKRNIQHLAKDVPLSASDVFLKV